MTPKQADKWEAWARRGFRKCSTGSSGRSKPDDVVVCFDPNIEQDEPVTGMTYGGTDGRVSLYTDDP